MIDRQVNAVTTGPQVRVVPSNFRDSRLNARSVLSVCTIDNQQYSTAVGGPIAQNKLHFFGNYEYEREPKSSIWNTPYPAFNVELNGISNRKLGGVRMDYQVSSKTRIMGKVSGQRSWEPFGPGASNSHPAATGTTLERNQEYLGQVAQVLSNRAVIELKVGYSHYGFENELLTSWSKHRQSPARPTATPHHAAEFRSPATRTTCGGTVTRR